MEHKSNGYGVTSLVLGIISIILCWIPIFGLVSGILGIIFATKQKNIFPTGMATSGLVTSIIGTIFSAIYNFIWLILGVAISSL